MTTALVTLQLSVPLQHGTQSHPSVFIHIEHANCGAANGRQTNDSRLRQAEVLFPDVVAWVKQRNDLPGLRVNPRQIRTFMCIAPVAGQGQVGRSVATAVLAGNDMLDVES